MLTRHLNANSHKARPLARRIPFPLTERVWPKTSKKLWHADRRRECGCRKKMRRKKGKPKTRLRKNLPQIYWRKQSQVASEPNQVMLRLQQILWAPVSAMWVLHVFTSCDKQQRQRQPDQATLSMLHVAACSRRTGTETEATQAEAEAKAQADPEPTINLSCLRRAWRACSRRFSDCQTDSLIHRAQLQLQAAV